MTTTARTRAAAILASTLLVAVTLPVSGSSAAEPAPRVSVLPVGDPMSLLVKGGVPVTRQSRLAAVVNAKTINYYPSNAGWSAMWTGFDAARIEADLAKAASLGADNVRIIVFPQSFGFPKPRAEYVDRLRKFVSIAGSLGLSVKLTLFDWWSGYADTAGSAAWARALLAPYAEDGRVLSVELKNEFVPTDPAAVAWARRLIPAVREAVPQMPLTLSVDGQSGAAGLARIRAALAGTPLDYYDYHFYGNSERALAEIQRAQAAVSPAPVVIGETGLSTATSSEGEQMAFLARTFAAAAEAGVRSVAPWTLYDFTDGAIPSNSQVSKMPAQYRFGLFRADGSAKPAVNVVRNAWAGNPLTNALLDLDFEASPGSSPWRPYLADEGVAVRTREVARSGLFSARFTGTTRTGSSMPSVRTAPVDPVRAGQVWHAVAWARGAGVTGSNEIALSWFDLNDRWLGQSSSRQVARGDSGWTRLTVDAVAPPGATSVQLHLKSGDNRGSVWFDDVTLSKDGS